MSIKNKKKLSFENGNIVLRDIDGTLFWNRHWVDMKGSYDSDGDDGGGYITVLLSEEGIEITSDFTDEENIKSWN